MMLDGGDGFILWMKEVPGRGGGRWKIEGKVRGGGRFRYVAIDAVTVISG
jgi:hypothetical protein